MRMQRNASRQKKLGKPFLVLDQNRPFGKLSFWIIFLGPACQLSFSTMKACYAERGPRQRERSAPHHRDRQVSPLGIGEEMRFVEDVASVAGLVPTGAGCRHPRVQGPLFGSSRRGGSINQTRLDIYMPGPRAGPIQTPLLYISATIGNEAANKPATVSGMTRGLVPHPMIRAGLNCFSYSEFI